MVELGAHHASGLIGTLIFPPQAYSRVFVQRDDPISGGEGGVGGWRGGGN